MVKNVSSRLTVLSSRFGSQISDLRSQSCDPRSEIRDQQPRTENRQPGTSRGFTLIELMVVVSIIGILAGIAVIQVKNTMRKAREAALRKDLHDMREAIDNFFADKQRYPSDLNELVPKYLKRIPPDPITKQVDWETIAEQPDADDSGSTDPSGAPAAPGIVDVKSKSPGNTMDDNVPYTEL